MGQGRVELPTSRLSGVRSNHLSYWPGSCRIRGGNARAMVTGASRAPPRSLETGLYAAARALQADSGCYVDASLAGLAAREAFVVVGLT